MTKISYLQKKHSLRFAIKQFFNEKYVINLKTIFKKNGGCFVNSLVNLKFWEVPGEKTGRFFKINEKEKKFMDIIIWVANKNNF